MESPLRRTGLLPTGLLLRLLELWFAGLRRLAGPRPLFGQELHLQDLYQGTNFHSSSTSS